MCTRRCCQDCRRGRKWRQRPKESASPASQCPSAGFPVRQTQGAFPTGSPGPRLQNTASPWTQSKEASLGTEVLQKGTCHMATRGPQQECHLSSFLFALSRQRDTRGGPGPSRKLGRADTWGDSSFSCLLQGPLPFHPLEALDGVHAVCRCGEGGTCLPGSPLGSRTSFQNCSEESHPQCSDWWLTQRGFEVMEDPWEGYLLNITSVWNPWGGGCNPTPALENP